MISLVIYQNRYQDYHKEIFLRDYDENVDIMMNRWLYLFKSVCYERKQNNKISWQIEK